MRCFFRWAHESGIATTNAARLLKRARCAPPPPKPLHSDEQQRLLDVPAAETGPEARRDEILVRLLLGTGIRIGSALELDVGDIDFDHGEMSLRTTKNNRPSTVILPARVAKKLKVFLGDRTDGPVFLARGKRISTRHCQRRLSEWLTTAGIEGKSAHSFRHSFATGLLARTGDLRLVQAALNHASIVSTTIYVAVDQAKLRAAVGASGRRPPARRGCGPSLPTARHARDDVSRSKTCSGRAGCARDRSKATSRWVPSTSRSRC